MGWSSPRITPILKVMGCTMQGKDKDMKVVRKALRGDQEAYALLYTSNKDKIYNYMFYLTHSQDRAEDLMQDTFLRAFKRLKQFKGESRFSTWIHRIAINEFLQQCRKHKLDTVAFEDMDAKIADNKLQTIDLRQKGLLDRMELHNALGTLAMTYRNIFIMHYVLGYEIEKIANVMDLSIPAVKARNYRARLELRRVLTGEEVKEYVV